MKTLPLKKLNILSTLIVITLLFLLLRDLDFGKLVEALRDADWGYYAIAVVVILILNSLGRIMRFRALLDALPHPSNGMRFWDLVLISMGTRTLNIVLPARAGEVYRAIHLSRHGYQIESATTALLVEPLLEALGLGSTAFALSVLNFAPLPFADIFNKLKWAFLIIVAAGIIFSALKLRANPNTGQVSENLLHSQSNSQSSFFDKIQNFFSRMGNTLHRLNSPRVWLKSLSWTWFADAADCFSIGLCLWAVHIQLDWVSWFVIFAGVNIAIALPTVPGNVGTLEVGAILVLNMLGVDKSKALAFTLLYHSVNTIPIALAGLIALKINSQRAPTSP